jgi:hypothetical protein
VNIKESAFVNFIKSRTFIFSLGVSIGTIVGIQIMAYMGENGLLKDDFVKSEYVSNEEQ